MSSHPVLVVKDAEPAASLGLTVAPVRAALARLVDEGSSNVVFAEAVAAGDVDGALAADDTLRDVLLRRCGNPAVVSTAERFAPVVRRLERQRFASAHGLHSVALHDRLIDEWEAGDVACAVAVTNRHLDGAAVRPERGAVQRRCLTSRGTRCCSGPRPCTGSTG